MSKIVFSLTEAQCAYLRAVRRKEPNLYRFDYRTFQNARDRGYVAGEWRAVKLTTLGLAIVVVLEKLEAKK